MKLHTAPQHFAEMNGGVQSLGEYKINNSPKAFAILSSGLYADKIRAILRELGCNAWDSHVAAGRAATPFDLHLPTQLEPWFAVRDYGVGLSHEQVVNIYTTYFESTKTGSNDFIGALGLGSKSPFSYTDNFTVTAIKNGRKGIYTAYINDRGVPAIALMMEEATNEPDGVEVKFAVNSTQDFQKFRTVATTVFAYFPVKPVVNLEGFQFIESDYQQKDIVPGIHQFHGRSSSRAVMGNIAYPIEVPNAEQNLGALASLLSCGLEIHFAIGELDFQASREGLSYIPMTVDAIKAKLEQLNASLYTVLAVEADAIVNEWTKALWLAKKYENALWRAAVIKYCADTNFDLFNPVTNSWDRVKTFEFTADELASKYNIAITGFTKYKHDMAAKNIKPDHRRVNGPVPGQTVQEAYWRIRIGDDLYFAHNDGKVGAAERGKYHWKVNAKDIETNNSVVYIAGAVDKTQPVKFAAFMADLRNPPRQCKVSDWAQKPRDTVSARDVSILKLEDKDSGYWSRRNGEKVWRDAGKADKFDPKQTYYYLPLSGYNLVTTYGIVSDVKELCADILGCGLRIGVSDIYGVRKADLSWVKAQKNWVNLEDHMVKVLKNISDATVAGIALTMYRQRHNSLSVSSSLLSKIADPNSAFVAAVKTFENVEAVEYNTNRLESMVRRYAVKGAKDPLFQARQMADKVARDFAKYPMLKLVDGFHRNADVIADYINLVDKNG